MSQPKEKSHNIQILEKQYVQLKNSMNAKKLNGFKVSSIQLQQMCQIMNVIAVKGIQQGQYQKAEEWLLRAQKYATQLPKMQISIQNNLACLYKKQQNYGLALVYLQKADANIQKLLAFHKQHKHMDKEFIVADCSLNMCAILSSMGEHMLALQQARKTIALLTSLKETQNRYYKEVYLVAKFNQAAELQHLHRWEKSLEAYKSAKQFGFKNIPSHTLNLQIQEAVISVQKKVAILQLNRNRAQKNLNFRSISSSPKLQAKQRNYDSLTQNYQTPVRAQKGPGKGNTLRVYLKQNSISAKAEKQSIYNTPAKMKRLSLKPLN